MISPLTRLVDPERWPAQPKAGMYEVARYKGISWVNSFFLELEHGNAKKMNQVQ